MRIGSVILEFFLPYSNSLKEKRKNIKSFMDRARHKFNISIAEIDFHDVWQRSKIGIAFVVNQTQLFDKISERIIEMAYNIPEVEVVKIEKDIL